MFISATFHILSFCTLPFIPQKKSASNFPQITPWQLSAFRNPHSTKYLFPVGDNRIRRVSNINGSITVFMYSYLRFFSDSRPWVATRYCRDRSVVRWRWSSWKVSHSGMNKWKDETSQMLGGHSSQQWYEDRMSTCKDQFERTSHKMCRHQLNEWAWKNDEKVRWKYQPDREDSCMRK